MRRLSVSVIVIAASLLSLLAPRAAAAREPSSSSSAEPGAELRVFLMTFSPGPLIYERFGHNTICIHDPSPPPALVARREAFEDEVVGGPLRPVPPFIATDRAYHYGAFDFKQENFVWRFLHGRLTYWMQSEWADLTALLYAADNRAVLLQELDLPPARKLELRQFLQWNERPDHRNYRYDYYRDNCSTRVRDVIDRATGGGLARQLQPLRTGATYRSHTRRANAGVDPEGLFWFTSFSYVLGHPVDVRLTAWEECFLPDALAGHVRNVRLPDGRGGGRPLVLRETLLAETTRPPVPHVEPRRTPAYGVAGVLLGAAFVGLAALTTRARRGRVACALAFSVLVVPWALLWGLGATIGTYGWAATDHAASYRNENLLQMTPLMLPLAFVAPAVAFGRRRGARLAVGLAVVGAGLSVLGFLLQVLPTFWQQNGEMIALALPANVGLAMALARFGSRVGGAKAEAVLGTRDAAART